MDDVFPVLTALEYEDIIQKVKKTIERILNYMIMNKLAVNILRTQVMLITSDQKKKDDFQYHIEGKTINNSTEMTELGTKLN